MTDEDEDKSAEKGASEIRINARMSSDNRTGFEFGVSSADSILLTPTPLCFRALLDDNIGLRGNGITNVPRHKTESKSLAWYRSP